MLTAAPISEMAVESNGYAIFAEWLAQYFDGPNVSLATHVVGGNPAVQFPKAVIQFGQSPIKQPLASADNQNPKASILCVWGSPMKAVRHWETVNGKVQLMIYRKAHWNFWVRAEVQASDGMNARKLCRQTAELLSGLLNNPAATLALGEKGMRHMRAGEPEPVAEAAYILMLVSARGELRYPVLVQ